MCSAPSSRLPCAAGMTCTARMIPAMRVNGGGRLVFCSSVLGLVAAPYRGAYGAPKFAPEAVAAKLALAAESRRPKSRYYVTIPTYAAVLFRRLLPTRAFDAVMVSN